MSSTIDSEGGIPEGLPSGTNEYQYKDIQDFLRIINAEQELFESDKDGNRSQYILFANIDEQKFSTDFIHQPDAESIGHFIDSYYPYTQIILVKMERKPHAEAHQTLTKLLTEKLVEMNRAQRGLHYPGGALIETPSRKKKADAEFLPRVRPEGRSTKWPSAVIETGYSESNSKLQADARWWLEESAGYVNTAFTIKVQRTRKEVVIQKWGLQDRPTRQNPGRQVAGVEEEVVISRPSGEDGISVRGRNGAIVLEFEKLFLRPPAAGERDVVFTDDDLRHLADMIWSLQEEE